MILVDSSVWIGHFRRAEPRLETLLKYKLVALHPFVFGRTGLRNLPKRTETILDF